MAVSTGRYPVLKLLQSNNLMFSNLTSYKFTETMVNENKKIKIKINITKSTHVIFFHLEKEYPRTFYGNKYKNGILQSNHVNYLERHQDSSKKHNKKPKRQRL